MRIFVNLNIAKLVDRKNNEELMKMLSLKEKLDKMAKANGVRWYGPVVRT